MNAKTTLITFLIIILYIPLSAQQNHLDVEGHSKIRGNLNISHMTDSSSVYIGRQAGVNTVFTQERWNSFLGVFAGRDNTSGHSNTFLGYTAGQSNGDGVENVFIGLAGLSNTSGSQNTFIGNYAGHMNTTGNLNTAIGFRALFSNTIAGDGGAGNQEVAVGAWALENSQSRGNVAVGPEALRNLSTGADNVGLGGGTLLNLTTGGSNTAVGSGALRLTSIDANSNTAVGKSAGPTSRGSFNTYIGVESGFNVKEGDTNIMIGAVSEASDTATNNQIVIGTRAKGIHDNAAVIGNEHLTDVYMSEDTGAIVHAANAELNALSSSNSDSVVVLQSDNTLAVRSAANLTTSEWYLGKDTLGGIVYYIYKGSDGLDHGLIVSKTESTAQWQSTVSTTDANRSWDGTYNTAQMTNSPAKDWITTNFTSEWYLPSYDELSILWHNRFHANKSLSEGGHTLLSLEDRYWSSTELQFGIAYYFAFRSGSGIGNDVRAIFNVRAIRAF